MKITVLSENTSRYPQLGAEHGLSLWIETDTLRIIFDMGQSDLFARNADAVDIDLSTADLAILSHGHYDHGGGIETFFSRNEKAGILVHPTAFEPYYNGKTKYIGLDSAYKDHPRIIKTTDRMQLGAGITLFSGNDELDVSKIDPFGLMKMVDGIYQPDDFRHEQYLLIEQNGKKVLFTGCAHKGVLSLAEWIKPDVLIGGFHFKSIPMDASGCRRLSDAADALQRMDTAYYTCHCTGLEQYRYIKQRMNRLEYLSVGDTLEL